MTYYSRRQLEALGEPLGDSVTRKEGGRIIYGGGGSGGGGSPPPQQNTTYNTNVPEYARPYVENMLESTQKQIYTDDMAGFRPYRPYSTNPNDYYAGFSPMQKAAQTETANLQTPGELGIAGAGSLLAGSQYAQNVTSPGIMQSYMSPYQQGVTDIAKNAAVREAQMAERANKLASARQGTYGGARQTLGSLERERNLLSNLSNIQAQGSQSAYDRALQSQQFGANLGLQGYGQAAQIGSQRQAADLARLQAQQTVGREQQAMEQNKINQQIQDYAIAQQYPFMQLGMMNAMLRGLPMQTQSTQLYQAQPSMLQQGIGLAGAAGSLFGGGRAAGGAIKEYREGGIVGYAPGGVIDSTRADLEQIAEMPDGMRRLEQIRNSSDSDAVRKMAAEIIAQKQIEAKVEQQTQKNRMSGIALAGGPAFESQTLAGGGIIAFQNGGYTNEELEEMARGQGVFAEGSAALPGQGLAAAPAPKTAEKKESTEKKSDRSGVVTGPKTLADFFNQQRELGPKGQVGEGFEKFIDEYTGDKDRLSRKERLAMAKGFLEFGSTAGPIGKAAIKGLGEYATGVEAARDAEDKIKFETAKIKGDLDKARRAEQRGDVEGAQKAYDSAANRDSQLKVAQMQLAKSSDFERKYALYAENEKAAGRTPSYEGFVRTSSLQDDTARLNAMAKAEAALGNNLAYIRLMASPKPEDKQKAEQMLRDKIAQYMGVLNTGPGTSASGAKGQVDTNNALLRT